MKVEHLYMENRQAFEVPKDVHANRDRAGSIALERDMRSQQKNALPHSEETVQKAAEQAEALLAQRGVSLKFKLRDDSGDLQVEVMDAAKEKVIRKIPPDELVKLAESLEQMNAEASPGAFFNALF